MQSKNSHIEALRGLAILCVLVGHAGTLKFWNADLGIFLSDFALGSGVDLFFCISGFVITTAYHDQLRDAFRRSLKAFAKATGIFLLRRFFRIMPAAVAWLVIVCACSIWFNSTGIFGNLQADLADLQSVVLNYSNFHFAKCIADAYKSGNCGYNGVYWSISLEEQFYFFFPVLVLVRKPVVFIATLAVFIALYTVERNIFVWFTRLDGLMLGVCLGLINKQPWRIRFKPSKWQVGIGWLVLLPAFVYSILAKQFLEQWAPSFYLLAITLLCGSLVMLAFLDSEKPASSVSIYPLFLYIGSRSFSLYLAHNPTFWLANEILHRLGALGTGSVPNSPLAFTVCTFVMLLVFAETSYRLIEVPFRDLGRRISGRLEAPGAGTIHGRRVETTP